MKKEDFLRNLSKNKSNKATEKEINYSGNPMMVDEQLHYVAENTSSDTVTGLNNFASNVDIDENRKTTKPKQPVVSPYTAVSRKNKIAEEQHSSIDSNLTHMQFIAQLSALEKQMTSEAIENAVIETNANEVIALVKKLALSKSLYMAKLLDVPLSGENNIPYEQIKEIETLRQTCSELEVGIETIKVNIQKGLLKVSGLKT